MRIRHVVLPLLGVAFAALSSAGGEKQAWIEVRSPNFIVASDAGDKQARHVAGRFEQIRAVFQSVYPKARLDPGKPIIIVAVKSEKTYRGLLPGYFEQKGHVHPSGLFASGVDKHYVALRMDVEGANPYTTVYHEYVHVLVDLNFESLPLWLNEGLADFYANSDISGKEAVLGRPDANHVYLLRQSKLLPLDTLWSVDSRSPDYNEESKATIFYAESWALVHYFMVGERGAHRQQLDDFLHSLATGLSPNEAANRALGDPRQLQKKLDAYVSSSGFYAFRIKASIEVDEKSFTLRELSPAEAVAIRGDFLAHTKRPTEARAELEQALRLDPQSVLARESMGLLEFNQGNWEAAARWFGEAVALNSQNSLAHYYNALLQWRAGHDPEALKQAEAGLRRTIELNPSFAPAYDSLANLYGARGENLEEAFSLAAKAIQLEPGSVQHRLTAARVLLRMGKTDQAMAIAAKMQAAARTEAERSEVSTFLSTAQRYWQSVAAKQRRSEELTSSELDSRKAAVESAPKEATQPPAQPPPPSAPNTGGRQAAPEQGTAPGEGTVTAVACKGTEINVTLSLAGLNLVLHAADDSRVHYTMAGREPPARFNPCRDLLHRYAQAEYHVVAGQPYAGELVSIDVRK